MVFKMEKILHDLLTVGLTFGIGVTVWYTLLPEEFWERLVALAASACGILFILACLSVVQKLPRNTSNKK